MDCRQSERPFEVPHAIRHKISESEQTLLVCGGAGSICSHPCKLLAQVGHRLVVLDKLSTGHRRAGQWGPLVEADLLQPDTLQQAFARHRVGAVTHFAARSLVGESVAEVLTACRQLHDGRPAATVQPRRPGDPARLVASAAQAREVLGRQPRFGLHDCIGTASRWHQASMHRHRPGL